MALSKKIRLDNGLELNYHVIDIIETTSVNSIKVQLDSFISKEYYDKAIIKDLKLKEQKDLIVKFNELASKEELTKSEQTKINRLQEKINKLADEIDNSNDYFNYVLIENIVELYDITGFSKQNIENELLKSDLFKNAEIVD